MKPIQFHVVTADSRLRVARFPKKDQTKAGRFTVVQNPEDRAAISLNGETLLQVIAVSSSSAVLRQKATVELPGEENADYVTKKVTLDDRAQ